MFKLNLITKPPSSLRIFFDTCLAENSHHFQQGTQRPFLAVSLPFQFDHLWLITPSWHISSNDIWFPSWNIQTQRKMLITYQRARPNPLQSRKKTNPQKTGIHQSNKTSPIFFLLQAMPQTAGFQRHNRLLLRVSGKLTKMLSWCRWRWKTSHLPSLRIYTPTASTVPACQYSPIAFIVFTP